MIYITMLLKVGKWGHREIGTEGQRDWGCREIGTEGQRDRGRREMGT